MMLGGRGSAKVLESVVLISWGLMSKGGLTAFAGINKRAARQRRRCGRGER